MGGASSLARGKGNLAKCTVQSVGCYNFSETERLTTLRLHKAVVGADGWEVKCAVESIGGADAVKDKVNQDKGDRWVS